MKTRLLYVEDDKVDRMAFERFAEKERLPYEYTEAGSIAEATQLLQSAAFDIIISDYLLGDGTAFDILKLNLDAPVIIATGAGSEQIAVDAMKAGAYDYLIKDEEHKYLKVLQVTVEKALRQKRTEERVKIQSDRESAETVIIGSDDGMAEVSRLIEFAASSDSPVLITGETGAGKNVVAKAIHYKSAARNEPFVGVNCLSLPEQLIEAELFGSEKGAYTGSTATRKGLFEAANKGTILLDEIGEMPLHLQGKLLSVIEDKKVRRIGGEIERAIDVRIIASTNVDVEKAVGTTFRRDLYYRLSIIRIHVPPLRERRRDIPAICHYLLGTMTGKREASLSDPELKKLMAYDWPGNVRELKNVLERAVILQRGHELRPSELLTKMACPEASAQDAAISCSSGDHDFVTLEEVENKYIKTVLDRFSGNRMKTAVVLGISLATLKRRLKDLGSN